MATLGRKWSTELEAQTCAQTGHSRTAEALAHQQVGTSSGEKCVQDKVQAIRIRDRQYQEQPGARVEHRRLRICQVWSTGEDKRIPQGQVSGEELRRRECP